MDRIVFCYRDGIAFAQVLLFQMDLGETPLAIDTWYSQVGECIQLAVCIRLIDLEKMHCASI